MIEIIDWSSDSRCEYIATLVIYSHRTIYCHIGNIFTCDISPMGVVGADAFTFRIHVPRSWSRVPGLLAHRALERLGPLARRLLLEARDAVAEHRVVLHLGVIGVVSVII